MKRNMRKACIFLACFWTLLAAVFYVTDLPWRTYSYVLIMVQVPIAIWMILRYMSHASDARKLEEKIFKDPESVVTGSDEEEIWKRNYLMLERDVRDEKSRTAAKDEEFRFFTSLWIHQVKTPLFALELMTENSDLSPEKKAEFRKEILNLRDYTAMVLNYGRISRDQTDLDISEVSAYEVISGVMKKYATVFLYDDTKVSIEGEDRKILTDSYWLDFILGQLLSNSLKYARGKAVVFRISDGAIEVEDTGIGIRKEELPRIFTGGFSGRNGRIGENSSGLGLYLVKTLCDRLGIDISAESEPNVRTIFTLKFPEKIYYD